MELAQFSSLDKEKTEKKQDKKKGGLAGAVA
jgi:hypothetical protein